MAVVLLSCLVAVVLITALGAPALVTMGALIASHLERIADNAWYTVQSVTYVVTGTYVV